MAPMSAFSVETRGMRFAFRTFQSVSCAVGAWCDAPLASERRPLVRATRQCAFARDYTQARLARSCTRSSRERSGISPPAVSAAPDLLLHHLVNRVLDIRREVDHAGSSNT